MTEEFKLRFAADMSAAVNGMRRFASYAKGWGASLVNDLKGHFGRIFAASAVIYGAERAFHSMTEKALSLKRATDETGFSTDFLQGAFRKLSRVGIDYEKLIKPLSVLTGMTNNNKKFIGDLAERYASLNTQEARNAMLMSLHIKNWQTLIPLLEGGRKGIEELESPNFFTKMSPKSIRFLSETKSGLAETLSGLGATSANTVTGAYTFFEKYWSRIAYEAAAALTRVQGRTPKKTFAEIWLASEKSRDVAEQKKSANQVDEEGFTIAERKVQAAEEELKVREKIFDLETKINDQGKVTIETMAAHARKILGTREPRAYGVSSRMRSALKIDQLEKRSEVEWEQGRDALSAKHWSEAQQMRASATWAMSKDQNPMRKTEEELKHIRIEASHVATMAKNINAIGMTP